MCDISWLSYMKRLVCDGEIRLSPILERCLRELASYSPRPERVERLWAVHRFFQDIFGCGRTRMVRERGGGHVVQYNA